MATKKVEDKVKALRINKCQSFADVQAYIKSIDKSRITFCLDKLLLKNTKYSDLLKLITKENKRLGSKDFQTIGRLKSHIAFRRSHDGWSFTENKEKTEIKLTGFTKPK